jgi:hypothetical protein
LRHSASLKIFIYLFTYFILFYFLVLLTFGRQALQHLSHSTSPFWYWVFCFFVCFLAALGFELLLGRLSHHLSHSNSHFFFVTPVSSINTLKCTNKGKGMDGVTQVKCVRHKKKICTHAFTEGPSSCM